jgi:hypothetical protein
VGRVAQVILYKHIVRNSEHAIHPGKHSHPGGFGTASVTAHAIGQDGEAP